MAEVHPGRVKDMLTYMKLLVREGQNMAGRAHLCMIRFSAAIEQVLTNAGINLTHPCTYLT